MLTGGKAATSFECDGCNHHASFHSLENKDEDAILKKWEEQQRDPNITNQTQTVIGASRKRKRIAEKAHDQLDMPGVFEVIDDSELPVDAVEEQLQQELVGAKRRRGRKAGS